MSNRNPSSDRTVARGVCVFLLLVLAVVLPSAVGAQSARLLDAPRAAGTVGERYDGYAVARASVAPDVAALIDKVNAERRAIYAQRAASEHVPIDAIGRIYAKEIVQSAPAGTWFLAENGQWTQK
jgi:uncharacterized protein YdbL (DUF1318 family)